MIDSLWPAARKALRRVQQGNKVRGCTATCSQRYFRYLHSVDDYKLRPEVDDRIRRSSQLILVPTSTTSSSAHRAYLPIAAKGVVHTAPPAPATANFAHPTIRPDARADRFESASNAPSYLL